MEIPWASSLRRYNRISVNMMLYWEVLRGAIEKGYGLFLGCLGRHGRLDREAGPAGRITPENVAIAAFETPNNGKTGTRTGQPMLTMKIANPILILQLVLGFDMLDASVSGESSRNRVGPIFSSSSAVPV